MALNPLNTSFPNAPLVDPGGNITPVWRRWFLAIMARTGGNAGTDAADAATAAQLAAETAARQAQDVALTGAIATEAAARATAVTNEADVRAAADAFLGQEVLTAGRAILVEDSLPSGLRISVMSAVDTDDLDGTELIPAVQGGSNAKWPLASLYAVLVNLAHYIPGNPLDAPIGSAEAGRAVTFESGAGDDTGDGGRFEFVAGDGGATSGDGGRFQMSGGGALGVGAGGDLAVTGGAGGSTSGDGGQVRVACGSAVGDGNGGPLFLTGGSGAVDGDGGDITIEPGTRAGAGRDGQLIPTLPTADPSVANAIWADGGVLVQSGFNAPLAGVMLLVNGDVPVGIICTPDGEPLYVERTI